MVAKKILTILVAATATAALGAMVMGSAVSPELSDVTLTVN